VPKDCNGATLWPTMETPHSMEVPTTRPPVGRAVRAFAELDRSSKLAIVCVVAGWFFMNTLIVSLGSLQHGVRFLDLSAVIADPTRLFFDIDTPFHRIFFGLICLVCLLAPLAAHLVKKSSAWVGYLAPLALMLFCGVLLYSRAPGDLVSRRISVGAGGYLALIGSMVLAAQGIRRFRHRA